VRRPHGGDRDKGLTKRFSSVAVDDLSFDVGGGTVTGFLEPNGSGKTTGLRVLLGLESGVDFPRLVRSPEPATPVATRSSPERLWRRTVFTIFPTSIITSAMWACV
jgi:ABC-type glutathione transport system ATPase component